MLGTVWQNVRRSSAAARASSSAMEGILLADRKDKGRERDPGSRIESSSCRFGARIFGLWIQK
jgi:hypothetical protein